MANKSANTDPQLKAAASPRMLVVRLPLRYAALARFGGATDSKEPQSLPTVSSVRSVQRWEDFDE
jgi:hypothetical protein